MSEKVKENAWKKTLTDKILSIERVIRKKSKWGHEYAFYVDNREVIHFEGLHSIDIRLTTRIQRTLNESLKKNRNIQFRKNRSEWVQYNISENPNYDEIIELILLAVEANKKH